MHSKQLIRKYLEVFCPMSDSDWEFFASKLIRHQFPKKSILLEVGQVEGYLSFVEKGFVRFVFPNDLEGDTFGFVFEREFLCAYDSFVTQTKSDYLVEALAEVVLWRIRFTDLQLVYENTVVGNMLGRRVAEALYVSKIKREKSLLIDTAAQRYHKLFLEKPIWVKQIPLKYLASYIGITPQALSRIRRRIS